MKSRIILLLFAFITACSDGNEGKRTEEIEAVPIKIEIIADTVLTNGRIYTGNPEQAWAETLAIKDGQIIYVGDAKEAQGFIGDNTEQRDLSGRFVMPGVIDAHVHPAWGGIKALYQCNFPFTATPDEIAATISKCVEEQPEAEWIRGGQWTSDFFVNNDFDSPRLWLDKVSGDKAVLLRDDSGHNMWVNSKALELAGINSDSEDPAGGSYEREADSRQPNGLLIEAFTAMNKIVPEWDDASYQAGAQYAVDHANELGITGFKDASASEPEVAGFYRLDEKGVLTAHVASCLYEAVGDNKNALNIEKFISLRERYKSKHVLTNFVKIFLDGVPTASRTAAMLAPYLPEHEGAEDNYGSLHLSPEELTKAVTELDKAGFTVKIHAAGDRAIRVSLDAIEAARKTNGKSGLRHELAHAELIDPADIPRFAELNVVADFSPYIWFPSPIVDSLIGAIGDRIQQAWPARALLDNKAPMLTGSDWPSAVPDMNPWTGMEALITRADPLHRYPGTIGSEHALTLEEAVSIYTLSGARALKIAEKTGTLEVGKLADLIVLNHNLFEIPAEQISDTSVDMTFFEGNLIYQKP
jgi:predicted amidohydrolase YtcJ